MLTKFYKNFFFKWPEKNNSVKFINFLLGFIQNFKDFLKYEEVAAAVFLKGSTKISTLVTWVIKV